MAKKPVTSKEFTDAVCAMLKRLHPAMDVEAVVEELLRGHTSPRALPEMPVSQLAHLLPERTAELVHLIPGITRSMSRNDYPLHPVLSTLSEASRFLQGLYLGLGYEHCYLLLLRKSGWLIQERMIQSGTVDSLPFYTRNIVEAVLAHEADAVVLSHNHPSGTVTPSDADLSSTLALIDALAPLEVPLVDHLIIAGKCAVSMRADEWIEPALWLAQPNHCPTLMKKWLNAPARR